VEVAGWVRPFDEEISLFFAVVALPYLVEFSAFPVVLPLLFYLLMVEFLNHVAQCLVNNDAHHYAVKG
jgi:hypothetical protein